MRDRLVELLNDCQHEYDKEVGKAIKENRKPIGENAFYADHLLAEGVIFPPCKVGQPIWHITRHYDGRIELREGKVSMLQQKADKSWKIRISVHSIVWDFTPSEIGQTYFLTKEEAERALAERRDG